MGLNLSLRWRIAALFGLGAILLTALLTGLGITTMAQSQFATARAGALESAEGASQTIATALATPGDRLSQVVASAARAAQAAVYVLRQGKVVAESMPGPPPALVRTLPAPAFPEVTFAVRRGMWQVVAVAPVAQAGIPASVEGEVVLVRPLAALQAQLTAIQRRLWMVGAAAALAFAALGFLLAQSIAAPLEQLTRVARRLSAGEVPQEMAAGGSGEVATLSRTFVEMAQRLAAVDAQRRRFVADAAHELRTPVAGLQALAESLVEDPSAPLPPEVRDALEGIRRESERLSRLVGQLLVLARLEHPQGTLQPRPLRVGDVAAEAVWVVHPTAEPRGVEVHLRRRGEVWAVADPDWLYRAVVNVLDNAVRHSPPGQQVEVEVGPGEEGWAEIVVADRGPGVPPPYLERLGERFLRLSPGRERASGGAGLGLAIVRDILAQSRGQLSFALRPGGGLRVTMRLPVAPVPPREEEEGKAHA